MKTISRESLSARLNSANPPVLIEALPAKYFQQWHLPDAININVDQVKDLAPGSLPDKEADIVVYCASDTCSNSDQVAVQLTALGYRNVQVYKGGKADWEAAGQAM